MALQGASLIKKVLWAYLQPALIIMCVAGGIRLGAGIVWAYNVKTYFSQLYCEQVDVGVYLTWVPLVGGTLGALCGGLVSDRLARSSGHRGRMWVLILSQVKKTTATLPSTSLILFFCCFFLTRYVLLHSWWAHCTFNPFPGPSSPSYLPTCWARPGSEYVSQLQ